MLLNFSDILTALNVTHIDWIVLDTEGSERAILQSFPWHQVTVDLIQLEVVQGKHFNYENINFFKQFLEPKGYQEENSLRIDMLFKRSAASLPDFNGAFKFGTATQQEITSRIHSEFEVRAQRKKEKRKLQ